MATFKSPAIENEISRDRLAESRPSVAALRTGESAPMASQIDRQRFAFHQARPARSAPTECR